MVLYQSNLVPPDIPSTILGLADDDDGENGVVMIVMMMSTPPPYIPRSVLGPTCGPS